MKEKLPSLDPSLGCVKSNIRFSRLAKSPIRQTLDPSEFVHLSFACFSGGSDWWLTTCPIWGLDVPTRCPVAVHPVCRPEVFVW